jgi:hypothetical protein
VLHWQVINKFEKQPFAGSLSGKFHSAISCVELPPMLEACTIKKITVLIINLKNQGMNNTNTPDERIAKMTFASVYPMYLAKVEKKGRSKEELLQVIEWLTGFDRGKLQDLIEKKVTFETFFQNASINPNTHLITGVICGYRVEEIENPLTQKVRYLDKLVDELAKGRKMEKILRNL